jgi:hypothetical protein
MIYFATTNTGSRESGVFPFNTDSRESRYHGFDGVKVGDSIAKGLMTRTIPEEYMSSISSIDGVIIPEVSEYSFSVSNDNYRLLVDENRDGEIIKIFNILKDGDKESYNILNNEAILVKEDFNIALLENFIRNVEKQKSIEFGEVNFDDIKDVEKVLNKIKSDEFINDNRELIENYLDIDIDKFKDLSVSSFFPLKMDRDFGRNLYDLVYVSQEEREATLENYKELIRSESINDSGFIENEIIRLNEIDNLKKRLDDKGFKVESSSLVNYSIAGVNKLGVFQVVSNVGISRVDSGEIHKNIIGKEKFKYKMEWSVGEYVDEFKKFVKNSDYVSENEKVLLVNYVVNWGKVESKSEFFRDSASVVNLRIEEGATKGKVYKVEPNKYESYSGKFSSPFRPDLSIVDKKVEIKPKEVIAGVGINPSYSAKNADELSINGVNPKGVVLFTISKDKGQIRDFNIGANTSYFIKKEINLSEAISRITDNIEKGRLDKNIAYGNVYLENIMQSLYQKKDEGKLKSLAKIVDVMVKYEESSGRGSEKLKEDIEQLHKEIKEIDRIAIKIGQALKGKEVSVDGDTEVFLNNYFVNKNLSTDNIEDYKQAIYKFKLDKIESVLKNNFSGLYEYGSFKKNEDIKELFELTKKISFARDQVGPIGNALKEGKINNSTYNMIEEKDKAKRVIVIKAIDGAVESIFNEIERLKIAKELVNKDDLKAFQNHIYLKRNYSKYGMNNLESIYKIINKLNKNIKKPDFVKFIPAKELGGVGIKSFASIVGKDEYKEFINKKKEAIRSFVKKDITIEEKERVENSVVKEFDSKDNPTANPSDALLHSFLNDIEEVKKGKKRKEEDLDITPIEDPKKPIEVTGSFNPDSYIGDLPRKPRSVKSEEKKQEKVGSEINITKSVDIQ